MSDFIRWDKDDLLGDFWGGLASMLVCLPAALAFGVAIYAPLGPDYAAQGALAGVAGAVILGILAPIFGDTRALITVPSGPAAAILGAFAAELVNGSLLGAPLRDPAQVLSLITLVGLLCGILQLVFGLLGGGTLIKYIPYPVASGFLSGVGILVFLQQAPALLGLPSHASLWSGLMQPALWQWPAVAVSLATIAAMAAAKQLTQKIPGPVVGLAAGLAVYYAAGFLRPELRTLDGNPLLLGAFGGSGGSFWSGIAVRLKGLRALDILELRRLFVPAGMMAILLSFDTLKTCVMVDSLTRTRHDSNRELRGQGVANAAAALAGGIPGSGMSGAMLINVASGARTRFSGVLEGVFTLLAFLVFSRAVAWVPLAALGGILSVVAFRMFDRQSLRLILHRATWVDFFVTMTVVAFTVCVSLLTATTVGLALAILLFIREQARENVIRRKFYGDHLFSRARRLPEETALLEREGVKTLICELQGSLFFGTTDQLFSQLLEDLKTRRFIILDLHRVQSVDFTAAHMLEQIEDQLGEHGGVLVFAGFPENRHSGQNLRQYFEEVGLTRPARNAKSFPDLETAMNWAEDEILDGLRAGTPLHKPPFELSEIHLLREFEGEELAMIASAVETKSYEKGGSIFKVGESGDQLFLIRKGTVRILLPIARGRAYHLASLGRGDFFGELAFLDRGVRSADVEAYTPTDVYLLSRARFDAVSKRDPSVGARVFARLALTLAMRLRSADAEVGALQDD